jgi:glycosyltransferase involved in cell wall biosynthesis
MGRGAILHVVTTIEMGGIEMLVRDLAAVQSRAGYAVHVCCAGGHAGVLAPDFAAMGAIVHVAAAHPRLRWVPRFARSMWQILRQVRPDILHIHTESFSAFIPILFARLCGVRAIVRSMHSCVPDGAERHLRRAWRHVEVALSVALGTHVVTVSQEVRRNEVQRLRIPPRWIHVIDNGVNPDRFGANGRDAGLAVSSLIGREAPRDRVFLLICVARLMPPKNHALLLNAMAELVARGGPREPHLLLVGPGDLEAELRRLASRLKLDEHVHFLGLRKDIPALLAASDAFAISSHFEGLPISVIEAMAAGKPIVATAVPGLTEIVVHEQTGLLVAPGDPSKFADALEVLLRDPVRCRRMGLAARARAIHQYSLEACARAYEALYRQKKVSALSYRLSASQSTARRPG